MYSNSEVGLYIGLIVVHMHLHECRLYIQRGKDDSLKRAIVGGGVLLDFDQVLIRRVQKASRCTTGGRFKVSGFP
jgi:hypothetical protein